MDNLLRVFFAFPQVRNVLSGHEDPKLGTMDITAQDKTRRRTADSRAHNSSWLDALNGRQRKYRKAQEVVEKAGTTWGKKSG